MTEQMAVYETGAPGVEPTPQLSFVGKLWNLFVDPRKTFASVNGGHEWLILWLLVSALSLSGYMPIKDIVRTDQMEKLEDQLAQNSALSEEDKQSARDQTAVWFDHPAAMLIVPISQLCVLLLVAGILLFATNILLGGNTTYIRMLNSYAWTAMLAIPALLVMVPLIMAKGSLDVSLGLGVLTNDGTQPFLKKVLTSFELFGVWQVWLSAVAVSVLGKAPMGKAFTTVFIIWFVWVLAQGGLSMIGVNFGM